MSVCRYHALDGPVSFTAVFWMNYHKFIVASHPTSWQDVFLFLCCWQAVTLKDSSKYGTFINGEKLATGSTKMLQTGDKITFGVFQSKFRFVCVTTHSCVSCEDALEAVYSGKGMVEPIIIIIKVSSCCSKNLWYYFSAIQTKNILIMYWSFLVFYYNE